MEFTKFDIMTILVMTLAIISMSFVFPALGLTGNQAEESNIPEFNTTASEYEFRGDFPNNPGQPSKGVMHWDEEQPQSEPSQAIWLDGGAQDGTEIALTNAGNASDPEMQVFLQNWTSGAGVAEDDVILKNVSDTGNVSYGDWVVTVEWTRQRNVGTENFTAEVDFTVAQQPSDVTWYGRIPVVGDILDAGSELAAIVGWIGSIFYWLMGTTVSMIWQFFALTLDILTFGFGMVHWMVSTYTDIISGASSWASVFLAIPGVLLSLELFKLALIGGDLIWIG